jgi:hypothetical protein
MPLNPVSQSIVVVQDEGDGGRSNLFAFAFYSLLIVFNFPGLFGGRQQPVDPNKGNTGFGGSINTAMVFRHSMHEFLVELGKLLI